jgi:glycosyltransferase involved in cell wall biosynthesis
MKISIIIPTLDRQAQLENLIGRLSEVIQNEELIIVDDSFDSFNIGDLSTDKFPIKYIHRGKKLGVSSARNVGATAAEGEYLLFFDDDDDFTEDWLGDFRDKLSSSPDLVHCDMKIIHGNGNEENVSAKKRNYSIVIPGAWVIKKALFQEIGGFDERLKFAENTELFFRIGKVEKATEYIEKQNFIYYQSLDGGSKNLQNMIDSILIILEKHDEILSNHVKYLYHQIVGVNQMRFKSYSEARLHLSKSWRYKPYKIKTLGRLFIACIPPLAKRLYPKEIPIK